MRYTSIEIAGNRVFPNRQLVTTEYFKGKAKKGKHPTRAADGVIYYMPYTELATVFLPETHPLFSYSMFMHQESITALRRNRLDTNFDLAGLVENFANEIIV